MSDFGDLDGRFDFFAVVTPDGKIPTLEDHTTLNDPAEWYTSPIGTISHLSDYALVFTDWDDAQAEYQQHRPNLGNYEGQCPSVLLAGELDDYLGAVDELTPKQAAALRARAERASLEVRAGSSGGVAA